MARSQKQIVELIVVRAVCHVLTRRIHLHNDSHERRMQIQRQIGRDLVFAALQKGKRKVGFVLRQMHFLIHTLLFGFFHGADELVQLQRLIEVIHGFELDGVFEVFFIGIAAEENDLQRWVRGQHLIDECNAVKLRHTDVTNDDIRVRIVDEHHGLQPVCRFTHDAHVHHFPVYGSAYALARHLGIVHNDHFIHSKSSPKNRPGHFPNVENKHKIKIFVRMACYIVIIITEFTANFQNCGINSRIF